MIYGTITGVMPGKHPKYNVRLDSGESIVVVHEIIEPPPAGLLKRGCRLVLLRESKGVVWASTDLTTRKKVPSGNLGPQAREPAQQIVTIFDCRPREEKITVRKASGDHITIRLPRENLAWSSVFVGHQFTLETEYLEDGRARYTLVLPEKGAGKPQTATRRENVDTSNNEPMKYYKTIVPDGKTSSIPKPAPVVAPHHASDSSGQDRFAQAAPALERIDVDRIGIDLEYLQAREKEGHRFEIMEFLREHCSDDLIEWYKMRPESPARFRNPTSELYPPVQQALQSVDSYYKRFYSHQAESLDRIREGKNLIIVTQTASGKTLCYNPAIFEHFLRSDPSAHALYVFPLNALLMDQKEKIDQLATALAAQNQPIQSTVLKAGVPRDERHRMAANPSHILALNPELLSVVLNESGKWSNFFSNLRYVVIDEVHTYRGILGMHTAGLIRHLLLTTRRYGVEPQFILSSATVCNPMDLATRLTSLAADSFQVISERDDGSYQANKHWVVLNPDAHDENSGYDNYLNTAAHTMVELINAKDRNNRPSPLNTILFAKSIREVKKAFKIVQENLKGDPGLASRVRHYTSADLSTDEKREIYNGLKTGQIIGVVSTNALEAGIDIGKLDACIIAGFPFWMMRMRQMAGRVGRHQEGIVLYVPHPVRSVDQYYRTNPELLLIQPPEAFVVDAENPYIARKHINVTAFSLNGISEDELNIFGSRAIETAQYAIRDKVMRSQGKKYYGTYRNYNNVSDPYVINGLRSSQQRPYAVCKVGDDENCIFSADCLNPDKRSGCGNQVAVLDQPYAYRDCHPGAVYEAMDGNFYKVESFDDNRRIIRVSALAERTLERTFAEESTSIEIIGQPKMSQPLPGGVSMYTGEVLVTRSFNGYYTYSLKPFRRCRKCKVIYDESILLCPKCRKRTGKYFNQTKSVHHNFPNPYEQGFEIKLRTVACWMTIPAEMEKELEGASPCKLPGEDNRVFRTLAGSPNIRNAAKTFSLSEKALKQLEDYVSQSARSVQEAKKAKNQNTTYLFPGVYDQCLLKNLRLHIPESKALELYKHLTGYPVTEDLKHVCRKCQTSVLLPAMHTLEHTVLLRYPSVALGDPTDLGSHTTLGHPSTGKPTIFWYDTYEGGLGAAEKLYDQIQALLENSIRTITQCSCTTLEGCPNCTQIGHCDLNNQALSKPAALILLSALLGKIYEIPLTPFIYSQNKRAAFDGAYKENEHVRQEHGIGEEAPVYNHKPAFDPYQILHIQKAVHESVVAKAYEVRSSEITNEVPAISVVELSRAYQQVLGAELQKLWNIKAGLSSYQILEILPDASLNLIRHVYLVISKEVHPDKNPQKQASANEVMKLVNNAYEEIVISKKKSASYDYEDMAE